MFKDVFPTIRCDCKASSQLRASALGVLLARDPHPSPDQYNFLVSKLDSKTDAVLRQTVARVLGHSAPDKDQLLEIGHKYLPQQDALTFSTLVECFRASHDEQVGQPMIT